MIEEKPSLDAAGLAPVLLPQSLPSPYGRYVLLERLGAGGMAEVFRAVVTGAEQFQSTVVVKRILPHLSENAAFVTMFIDEAKLCGRLLHPNIIRVHDFGKQDDRYFIAMEYVQGRTIGSIISRLNERRERMRPTIAAEIIRQACLGLAHAHGLRGTDGKPLGIIHRDVSPGNLMVDYNGAIKVLDFGVARVASSIRRSITDPGHVKGKSAYLAPEQMTGKFDHRADIFSVGILLHEMLSGRRLFKAQSSFENMKLVQSMVIPPPSQLNPDVPPALDAIVLRALARDPAARFPTAAALGEALARFLLEARAQSQDLPDFMQTVFEAEQREDERALAREALERRSLTPGPTPVPVLTGTADVVSPALVTDWPELDEAELADAAADPRRQKLRALALAGVALAACVVIGFFITRPRPAPPAAAAPAAPPAATQPAPPAPPPAPAPAEAAAAAEPTPAQATPPPPATVQISVSSDPSGATVHRTGDNALMGATPLVITATRGETELAFRIGKPGYVEGLLKMVPAANQSTLITLAKRGSRRNGRDPKPRKVIDAVPSDPFSE